jgi:hypothetical protein
MNDATPYGFRIIGTVSRERKLVDYDEAFVAYANCDDQAEIEKTAFLSSFQYDDAIRERILDKTLRIDTKSFEGCCWSQYVWFDIDDEGNIASATDSARRLCACFLSRYGLDESQVLVFFSGSKGFHIGVPVSLFEPAPSTNFNSIAKCFAERLATVASVRIDTAIYGKVQPFRAPNSRHNKTDKFKRFLTIDELRRIAATGIVDLARVPLPFELPSSPGLDQRAVEDWNEAIEGFEVQTQEVLRLATDRTQLNRATLDFIRDGAPDGERNQRLFSAAANLAEFGCSVELATALLTESALWSGSCALEVKQTIHNGIQHVTSKRTTLG